jgi:crotonobetainyl-CoA:carnitine CoA-transferase CaiB-like acyl-CoA transferase/acyl-CoA synthetase (AMP-forming)/AMP-acid ligase II
MTISIVLDMALATYPDRLGVGRRGDGLSYEQLSAAAAGGAAVLAAAGARHAVFVGENGPALPVLIFAAAAAGVPVVPLNYRLAPEQIRELVAQLDAPVVIADEAYLPVFAGTGPPVHTSEEFLDLARSSEPMAPAAVSDGDTAVVLFTSGTTARPKGVLLRHQNLTSYILQTVEFASADEDDAALVSTPPYHIAGIGAVLSNLFAGRRIVYLPGFSPQGWLETVRSEGITNAMVVPTMLARIVDFLDGAPAGVPTLRSLAYGGARMPLPVLERALAAFPDTAFTNAYGLTETSSTIAVLGPEEHRSALTGEAAARRRLASAGRIVPGVEAEVRSPEGTALTEPGQVGLLWVRGAQVSGDYLEAGSVLDADGWFPTKDLASFDADGYLFLGGRDDDTIIRGGENIAPAEIEDALLEHPAVREVAVVGVPDDEWGERIAAVIVAAPGADVTAAELQAWTRSRLRGSRTPDEVRFAEGLPQTATGKVIRREVTAALIAAAQPLAAPGPAPAAATPPATSLAAAIPPPTSPAAATPPPTSPAPGPMAGIRVVELAGIGPAPYAAMLLADLGAKVIRIERPGTKVGDPRIHIWNRGKQSVMLDLKSPRGIETALELVDRADVLIEGFRPGVTERLGLGPEACHRRNPGLVYGRMTGWGQDGPLAGTAGHDIDYIARTGTLHAIGRAGGPPQIPLNVVGDFGGGGMLLAFGIAAALVRRAANGQGQVVDAAIVDGVSSLLATQHALSAEGTWHDERGVNVLDSGAPYYDVYETADGRWMAVGAIEPQFYRRLTELLELTDLPDRDDRSNWPVIRERIGQRFRTRTRSEWAELLEDSDACAAPVLSLAEAGDDRQISARQSLLRVDGVLQSNVVPRFSGFTPSLPPSPPVPGADTAEALREWGIDDVTDLLADGIAEEA